MDYVPRKTFFLLIFMPYGQKGFTKPNTTKGSIASDGLAGRLRPTLLWQGLEVAAEDLDFRVVVHVV